MKKFKGKLTLLINMEAMHIDIVDEASNIIIVRAEVSPEQTIAALSRLGNVSCDVQIPDLSELENVGKGLQVRDFRFEITDLPKYTKKSKQQEELLMGKCHAALKEAGMSEWTPDNYWDRQNTFSSSSDGSRLYAKAIIRRWV